MRKLKYGLLMMLMLLNTFQANAQRKRSKYLIEQIAAWQLYLGYVRKGYNIARDGLTLIGDIKNGELDLHKDYFNSLKNVNPAIKKEAKVAATMATQLAILQEYKRAWKSFKSSGSFSSGELDYFSRVYSNLVSETLDNINELLMITSDSQLQMKDNERQKNIDHLYTATRDQYSFLVSFDRRATLLMAQRKTGTATLNDLKQWYP
jgi:hypothetical protein